MLPVIVQKPKHPCLQRPKPAQATFPLICFLSSVSCPNQLSLLVSRARLRTPIQNPRHIATIDETALLDLRYIEAGASWYSWQVCGSLYGGDEKNTTIELLLPEKHIPLSLYCFVCGMGCGGIQQHPGVSRRWTSWAEKSLASMLYAVKKVRSLITALQK